MSAKEDDGNESAEKEADKATKAGLIHGRWDEGCRQCFINGESTAEKGF